jgi:tRNA U34 5-methylaminomethyl-2-thiouridine-forming methyltransferase MnmC
MKKMNNNYHTVLTEDGTLSLFSNDFNELMHNNKGAYQEALQKHIYPSNILNNKKSILNVLDVGFGMGYNLLALLNEFKKLNKQSILNLYSLELNNSTLDILNKIKFNDARDLFYKDILKAFKDGSLHTTNYNINFLFGDARDSIKNLQNKNILFDAIFQDPFSPAKNPELWSVEYFQIIYQLLDNNGILTTYSTALQIRNALLENSFKIGKSITAGNKEGTTAAKKAIINQLDNQEIKSIQENIKSTPYNDQNLKTKREDILEKRILTMQQKRKML